MQPLPLELSPWVVSHAPHVHLGRTQGVWNLPPGDPLSPPSTARGAGKLHSVTVQEWKFWACGECHSQWEIRREVCGRIPLCSLKRSEPYAFNSKKRCMRLPLMWGPGYQIADDWSSYLQSWSGAWVWHMAKIFWQTSVFSVGFFSPFSSPDFSLWKHSLRCLILLFPRTEQLRCPRGPIVYSLRQELLSYLSFFSSTFHITWFKWQVKGQCYQANTWK